MTRHSIHPTLLLTLVPTALMAQVSYPSFSGWSRFTWDLDGDGYARIDAPGRTSVPSWAAVCKRGDQDDTNAAVHPRRLEVYGNDIDDDCDGLVDEPWVEYFENGMANDSEGFAMVVHVSDARVIEVRERAWPSTRLYCRIDYQRLSDTSGVQTVIVPVSLMGVDYSTVMNLDGLASCTVYRARVQFMELTTVFGMPMPTLSPVGETSAWYYTITGGTDATSRLRAAIVLRAFYEFHRSEDLGEVGHKGTAQVDGTSYGADAGSVWGEPEAWCSEFYSTVVRWGGVASMATQSGRGGITDFFTSHNAYRSYETSTATRTIDLANSARPGDYMRLSGHSAMFLAYDRNEAKLWTVDGNIDGIAADGRDRLGYNEVQVTSRNSISSIIGWGSIVSF